MVMMTVGLKQRWESLCGHWQTSLVIRLGHNPKKASDTV